MERAESSDAELVAASQRGDQAAFGAIVERYQRAVSAVSYSGTRDRSLGDDVAQDTFVTAWRQLGALRDPSRLPAWLCGIARNLSRGARARRAREIPFAHEVAADATPYDAISTRETEAVVAAALERVPATYREPLVLYYAEDHSIKEVAHALGISEAAAQRRLSRGRNHLANDVVDVVERTLERRPRRDLAVGVLAAIAAIGSSHVEAAPVTTKGMSMWKIGIAAALAATITGGYLVTRSGGASAQTKAPPRGVFGTTSAGDGTGARSAPSAPALAASGPGASSGSSSGELVAEDRALYGYLPSGVAAVAGGNYGKLERFVASKLRKTVSGVAGTPPEMDEWVGCLLEHGSPRMAGAFDTSSAQLELKMVLSGTPIKQIASCAERAHFKATMDGDEKFIAVQMTQTISVSYLVLPTGALYTRQSFPMSFLATVAPGTRPELEGDIAALAQRGTVADDKELLAIMAKADRSKMVWFALDGARTSSGKVGEGWMSLDLSSGIAIDATVQIVDAKLASHFDKAIAALKHQAGKLPPELQDVVNSASFSRTGDHVHFAASLTDAQLTALVSLLPAASQP